MIKNIIASIIGALVGFLLGIAFFKELFILVPVLITVILVYILQNKEYYKKREFVLGLAVFVLVHSHWFLSLDTWVGIFNAALIWFGIGIYFFILWYIFFYGLKYVLQIPKGYYLIPICWTIFEWIMSLGIFGYPFMSLYLTQAGSSFQWLSYSIINSYAITLILLTFCLIVALVITGKFHDRLNVIFFVTFFFIVFVVAMNSYFDRKELKYKTVVVSVVQPNIPQVNKIDDKLFDDHLSKYFDLINVVIKAHPETEIMVLPENIIPALWEEIIKDRLCFSTNLGNRLLIFGQAVKREERIFNAMLFYKQGQYIAEYHKRQLVPFGEFLPFFSDWINLNDLIYYYPGGNMKGPISIQSLKIAPLVCFETAFPYLSSSLKKFNLGVVVTNDAWFNKYFKILHLRTVQFRATETLTPFVYSTNNGISAIIDHMGKIMAVIPEQKSGYISAQVKMPSCEQSTIMRLSFYLPIWLFVFLLVLYLDKRIK